METENLCLACGACCAFFRVSFYWAETDAATPEGVPSELTEKMNDFRVAMLGSASSSPRCVALCGFIGRRAACSIYAKRSSVCRDFTPSWENGQINPRCDQARSAWGLTPLLPDQWYAPGDLPKAA